MREQALGKFIAFEGIDGSGKTVQAEMLALALEEMGYEVVLTREPGGTDSNLAIRQLIMDPGVNKDPKVALCLFLADRVLHLQEIIRPALKEKKIVICDRYEDSTLAYQAFADGLDFGKVNSFNEFITEGLNPDVTILFDLPAEVALSRKKNPGLERTHYDQQTLEYHQKLQAGFLALSKLHPGVVIDATQDPQQIHQKVLEILKGCHIIGKDFVKGGVKNG